MPNQPEQIHHALNLEDVAGLPLERCVWSAALADSRGGLTPVGHIDAKDRAAAGAGLAAVGVAAQQAWDGGAGHGARSPAGLLLLQAHYLAEAIAQSHRLGAHTYGSRVDLPDALRLA